MKRISLKFDISHSKSLLSRAQLFCDYDDVLSGIDSCPISGACDRISPSPPLRSRHWPIGSNHKPRNFNHTIQRTLHRRADLQKTSSTPTPSCCILIFPPSQSPTMARPPLRRSSRISTIQSPSSPPNPPTPHPRKRKFVIDSDSDSIQVSSPPPRKYKLHPPVSSSTRKHKGGSVSPKSASRRTKKKQQRENEGTGAREVVVVDDGDRKVTEMRDVAVGPDESMSMSQDTGKDALDIVQATFTDDITCPLCCMSPNLT